MGVRDVRGIRIVRIVRIVLVLIAFAFDAAGNVVRSLSMATNSAR
jgi:hypothetical protein